MEDQAKRFLLEQGLRSPSMIALLIMASGVAFLAGQSSQAPYAELSGPTFRNLTIRYVYARPYKSIRDADFDNLVLHIFDNKGRPRVAVRVRHRRHEWKEETETHELTAAPVAYLSQVGGTDPQYAMLIFSVLSVAGSSSTETFAQVFQFSNQQLRIIQQLSWDEHFDSREKHSFDPETKTLVIRTAHYLPGDAHCCVSAVDVYTMHWNSSAFIPVSMQTELTDYGKRAGKKL